MEGIRFSVYKQTPERHERNIFLAPSFERLVTCNRANKVSEQEMHSPLTLELQARPYS